MLISQEREHLEHIYIDYLRSEYPSLESFREYAASRFHQDQYAIKDRTEQWSRDVRVCVLSQMSLPDIIRLCKTNKKWSTIIHSSSYNCFWQSLYLRDFYKYVPTGNGVIPFTEVTTTTAVEPQVKKRRTKKVQSDSVLLKTILWFDLYLYTWSRLRHIFPLNKRTFRTFISHKYQADVPNGFPEMSFSSHESRLLPLKAFPNSIINLVNLSEKIGMLSAYDLSKRLFKRQSIFTYGVRLESFHLIYVPDRCIGKTIEFLFDEDSVIFKLLSETKLKWNVNSRFLISQPTYAHNLFEAMCVALMPTEDVVRKFQWEYFFTSLSVQ